jgi:hypothetical protein
VFVRLRDDGDEKFTDGQWKSLGAVAQMVERNGGAAFDSLKSAALHINAVAQNTTNHREMVKWMREYANQPRTRATHDRIE